MDSDYAIVTPSPDLAAALGSPRVMVEALELCGDAIFRGAYVPNGDEPGEKIAVTPEQAAQLIRLFCEVRRVKVTDDLLLMTVRHYKDRSAGRYVKHTGDSRCMMHRMRGRR